MLEKYIGTPVALSWLARNHEGAPCWTPSLEDHVETSEADQGSQASPILRIAVATREGERVDLHFGHAEAFFVYDVDADGPSLVEARVVAEHALNEEEDTRDTIYRMVADCKILLRRQDRRRAAGSARRPRASRPATCTPARASRRRLREVYAAKMEAA